MNIDIVLGDITKIKIDAIVNAANVHLIPGGGVDGAIHRAAGMGLEEECKKIGGCPVGEAKLTSAHNIPVKGIIHTVGPIWFGGGKNEYENLESAYKNSLRVALDNGFKSVAFPCISTGVFSFPKKEAALIAFKTVIKTMTENPVLEKVVFCCFSKEDYDIYTELMRSMVNVESKKFIPYY